MAMKNTTEAARAYQKATDLDPNCAVSILDNRTYGMWNLKFLIVFVITFSSKFKTSKELMVAATGVP